MPKKRIFNSTELLKVLSVYPRGEPFAKKPISSLRNLEISFVKKCETFRASYETFKGSVQNQYFLGFTAKSLRFSCETLKDPYFPTKPFLSSVAKK